MLALRSSRRFLALWMPLALVSFTTPALAQYRQDISDDAARCRAGAGPAVQVALTGVRSNAGTIRVQLYRGTQEDWLESGRWIYRIESPARAGQMSVCMPVPRSGTYAIAVRHDVDGNGKTDLRKDGGGMSNNPSINVFNLGKPSYRRTAFSIGNEVKPMNIQMRYLSGS